jgi:hypothetical protein
MGADASCAFNEGVSLRLHGQLDVAALQQAFGALVGRHEALRTMFDASGDDQRVRAGTAMEMPLLDLAGADTADRDERLRRVIVEEARTPFDLVEGPLVRARLVRLEPELYDLVLTAHHLAADGWSTNVLLNDLASLYSSLRKGEAIRLSAPTRFSDFAARESARREGPEGAATAAYWLKEFSSPPPVLDLPVDRPRPAVKTYSGATARRTISSGLANAVRRAGARDGCTLFATLFAAFTALLHRLTGQEDLVVGIPAAGQASAGCDDLVGHCVHFLPIRARATGDPVFRDYLQSIRRQILDAYDHQDYTYGRLIQKLSLARDPSRLPLIEAQFNLERIGTGLHFEGLRVDVDTNPKSLVHFSKASLAIPRAPFRSSRSGAIRSASVCSSNGIAPSGIFRRLSACISSSRRRRSGLPARSLCHFGTNA